MRSTRHLIALVALLAFGLAGCGAATADPAAPDEAAPGTSAPPAEETPAPQPTSEAPATDEPSENGEDDRSAITGCSGPEVDYAVQDLSALPQATRDAALFLLDAVRRCDEQLLVTMATESGTQLTFGDADPTTYLTLPEREGEEIYGIIARLIAGTTPALADGAEVWVFPAVTTGNGTDADWQSLVDSGLYTPDEVAQLKAAGDGYLGWRLGIDVEGNWTFFVAGD